MDREWWYSKEDALCVPGVCQGLMVTQEEKFILVPAGGSAEISCTQDSDNLQMFWYQQKAGRGLQLLVHSQGPGKDQTMEGVYGDRWRLDRDAIAKSKLTLTGAKTEDAAGYFCATSTTDTEQTIDAATKLSLAAVN
ncbi:hypothetical protein GDO86_020205 [Hymenochirus boettgeri]|uniref:Ig-like domain-containing protein n=1 Tax=Hymenochirus boettgeri TaxID=247094 RepID=A0A8T2IHV1_9PIPI|nr:hypothetical protein GDO86_020205 [Hymenochirus boettgeri]